MDVVIYARISTNRGEQNIKQQIDYLKEYAKRESLDVLKVFKDEESGKSIKRRGFERLLLFLKENPDVGLLVQDTDRLTRDFKQGVELENFITRNNIKIISLSEVVDLNSPNGRFMFRIKLAMNNFYIENLHEKIKVGVARAKLEGKYKGRKKGALGTKTTKRWKI